MFCNVNHKKMSKYIKTDINHMEFVYVYIDKYVCVVCISKKILIQLACCVCIINVSYKKHLVCCDPNTTTLKPHPNIQIGIQETGPGQTHLDVTLTAEGDICLCDYSHRIQKYNVSRINV